MTKDKYLEMLDIYSKDNERERARNKTKEAHKRGSLIIEHYDMRGPHPHVTNFWYCYSCGAFDTGGWGDVPAPWNGHNDRMCKCKNKLATCSRLDTAEIYLNGERLK